jgi:hypothetical protein
MLVHLSVLSDDANSIPRSPASRVTEPVLRRYCHGCAVQFSYFRAQRERRKPTGQFFSLSAKRARVSVRFRSCNPETLVAPAVIAVIFELTPQRIPATSIDAYLSHKVSIGWPASSEVIRHVHDMNVSLVRRRGLEPLCLAALAPQASASANFATSA